MLSKKIIDEWLSAPFDQETQDSVKALLKIVKNLRTLFINLWNLELEVCAVLWVLEPIELINIH
jgi:hypothetical protein